MQKPIATRAVARRILISMLIISCVLFAMHIVLKYISVVIHQEEHLAWFEISNRFDMNDENSVPQWFTLVSFLTITAGSFLAAYLARGKAQRRLWAAIGVLALLLSIDDAAAIHESLLGLIHLSAFDEGSASLLENAWLFIVPVVAVVGIWLLIRAVQALPRRTVLLLAGGGITFLTGAILVDSLANLAVERSFTEQGIIAGIEGFLQLIGLSLLVCAVIDYLERLHGAALRRALRVLKQPES